MQQSREKLKQAYLKMKLIREFEDRLAREFERGTIPGFLHLYSGQEAIAVGVCENLEQERDFIGSTHRGHGHCIAKGVDVKGMMKEIYGKAGGICKGKGGSMHIADLKKGMLGANAIVGGAPPLALGAALTAKTKKTGGVSIPFIGDGAANQGTVAESLNMAVVLELPIVFVFENNGYAEFTASSYATAGSIEARARGYGMPATSVDGADFFSVYQAVGEAVDRARAGDGPSAVIASAPRFWPHYTGDAQKYRPRGEGARLREGQDCLVHFRGKVEEARLLEPEDLDLIDQQVAETIDEAVMEAMGAENPDPASLYDDVYVSYRG